MNMTRTIRIACVAVAGFCFPAVAMAYPSRAPDVQVLDYRTQEVEDEWQAFSSEYSGGIDMAVGDFGGDGVFEYAVAHSGGESAKGKIRTFRRDHSPILETSIVQEEGTGNRLHVESGDVDGDGKDEIIVSVFDGARSYISILNGELELDAQTIQVFEAFPEFECGATVTVGNVLGDEREEIIVGTGQGVFPLVRIFDEQGVMRAPDITPFSEFDLNGLSIAAINTGGGTYDDIAIGFQQAAQTWIKNYRIDALREYPVLAEFRAWSWEFKSGVQLAGIDVDRNGTEEIAVAPSGDQRAEIKFFRGDGEPIDIEPLYPFEEDFRGGIAITAEDLDSNPAEELIVAPRQQQKRADPDRPERYIEVNLSEQVMYVWEDGYLRNVFLISSGLPGTPTPAGEFSVFRKILNHLYAGPGYYLPNTPFNLAFATAASGMRYYLHSAYWHNNFGHPMSHGCVNMRYHDAEFLYYWAEIGTPVWTHYSP